jgi:hypothetical protein
MRFFRATFILIALYTIDHMYLDGQNATVALSIARSVGASIKSTGGGFIAASSNVWCEHDMVLALACRMVQVVVTL